MILRQKIALSLIARSGGRASRMQLVKWLFLLAHESRVEKQSAYYQFVPYKFGPFSFTLYQELDALVRAGELTASSDNDVTLANPRITLPRIAEHRIECEVGRIWEKYGRLSTTSLVDSVYSRYPWFTLNSEQSHRRAVKRPLVECAIYTAGYENLHVDGFLNLLLQSGIMRLVDVRHNPISRKFGFHKSTLAKLCGRLGMEYHHEPEVGIPSAWRSDLQSQNEYDRLFDRYEREILPANTSAIDRIAALMREKPSVLVCQELEPCCCHRTRLANLIETATSLPIRDLRTPS